MGHRGPRTQISTDFSRINTEGKLIKTLVLTNSISKQEFCEEP